MEGLYQDLEEVERDPDAPPAYENPAVEECAAAEGAASASGATVPQGNDKDNDKITTAAQESDRL